MKQKSTKRARIVALGSLRCLPTAWHAAFHPMQSKLAALLAADFGRVQLVQSNCLASARHSICVAVMRIQHAGRLLWSWQAETQAIKGCIP